jgi:hypothetical protein
VYVSRLFVHWGADYSMLENLIISMAEEEVL